MRRTAFYIIVIPLLFSGIFFFQNTITRYTASETWKTESLSIVPADEGLRPALIGFDYTISHVLWIKTVLYFGSHYMTDRSYPWIIRMVDIITRLNPHFYPAYEFAGIMLPSISNNPDAARVILERGFSSIGEKRWNIGFYLGMLYYNYYDNKTRAAEYISMAALVPGAPVEKLIPMASAFYSQAGKDELAMQMLKLTVESSQNPEVRRYLAGEIQKLMRRQSTASR